MGAVNAMRPDLHVDDVPSVVAPIAEAADAGQDLKPAFVRAITSLGFEHFDFLCLDRSGSDLGPRWSAWGTCPASWADRYRERNYIAIDPVHRGAMRTALPLSWSADSFAGDKLVAEYFDDAAACDIRSGVSFVLPSPRPRRLQILIAYTSARSISPRHARAAAGDLWALGAYGHAILRRTGTAPDLSSPGQRGLTAREHECLLLVAKGATSRDIALALSISMRTADAHVSQAVKKLGARNRREAVAIALSEGLLRR